MKMIRQVALLSLRRTNGVGVICFDGWFSNEDQMPLKDAFPAVAKPALARKPNPAYTEVMIQVKPPHPSPLPRKRGRGRG